MGAKVRRKNRTAKKKGGFPLPNWHKAVKPYNYENASSSIFIPNASVIFNNVVSDGLRLPFSMSQMVVARMSTFSESSARVMPRVLRWFLMVEIISSCVIVTGL